MVLSEFAAAMPDGGLWHKVAVASRLRPRPNLRVNRTKSHRHLILAPNVRYRGESCRGGDIVATFTTDQFGKIFLKFFFRMTFRSRIGNPGDLAVGLVCGVVGSHMQNELPLGRFSGLYSAVRPVGVSQMPKALKRRPVVTHWSLTQTKGLTVSS